VASAWPGYLDPEKDAEKYAPFPTLGWDRAYRSGDLVRFDPAGLVFQGRADDQVKVGGRRIELGEIEAALHELPGVSAASAVVRETAAGNQVLVGYLAVADPTGFDRQRAVARLREELPAALVPLLAVLDQLPVRVSGKVDKAALPWPLPGAASVGEADPAAGLSAGELHLAEQWGAVLGIPVTEATVNFFDLGGGSLAAAQLVARIRDDDPEFTVAEIYTHPRLGAMADAIAARVGEIGGDPLTPRPFHRVTPTPVRMQVLQTVLGIPLYVLSGVRWLVYLLAAGAVLRPFGGFEVLPVVPLWSLIVALAIFCTPFGRMAIAVVCARLLLLGLRAGDYPRGGSVHLRLWLAEQAAHLVGAVSLSGAPWISYYARALGAKVGRDVDLHTLPPVTGMLTIGDGASVEPEVDLSGYWIDGDVLRVGAIRIGAESSVGARSNPASRRPDRQARRDRRRLRRLRAGAFRAALGRIPGPAGGPARGLVARGPSAAWPPLGRGVRPVVHRALPFSRWSRWRSAASWSRWASRARPRSARRGGARVRGDRAGDPGIRDRDGRAGRAVRPSAVVRRGRGHLRGAQQGRLAGLEHRASARPGPRAAVPALFEPVHAGLAPDAGGEGRSRRRGIDGAAAADDDHDPRRGVPGRRHHDREL